MVSGSVVSALIGAHGRNLTTVANACNLCDGAELLDPSDIGFRRKQNLCYDSGDDSVKGNTLGFTNGDEDEKGAHGKKRCTTLGYEFTKFTCDELETTLSPYYDCGEIEAMAYKARCCPSDSPTAYPTENPDRNCMICDGANPDNPRIDGKRFKGYLCVDEDEGLVIGNSLGFVNWDDREHDDRDNGQPGDDRFNGEPDATGLTTRKNRCLENGWTHTTYRCNDLEETLRPWFNCDEIQQMAEKSGCWSSCIAAPTPAPTPAQTPICASDRTGAGVFSGCADCWCLQSGTEEQYTSCGSLSNNDDTCNNPVIKYGTAEGGIPADHSANNYDQWCQQLGGSSHSDVQFTDQTTQQCSLFWCSAYDSSNWKWCDWWDGNWKDADLDYCFQGNTHITSITCAE